ncbi:hypothetical protein MMC18_007739 [Xylographa bjoerkii]|nr:hypothetical protein [Xylographa bjoerkii]
MWFPKPAILAVGFLLTYVNAHAFAEPVELAPSPQMSSNPNAVFELQGSEDVDHQLTPEETQKKLEADRGQVDQQWKAFHAENGDRFPGHEADKKLPMLTVMQDENKLHYSTSFRGADDDPTAQRIQHPNTQAALDKMAPDVHRSAACGEQGCTNMIFNQREKDGRQDDTDLSKVKSMSLSGPAENSQVTAGCQGKDGCENYMEKNKMTDQAKVQKKEKETAKQKAKDETANKLAANRKAKDAANQAMSPDERKADNERKKAAGLAAAAAKKNKNKSSTSDVLAKPVDDKTKSGEEPTKPAEEHAKQADLHTKPVEDSIKPADEPKKPAEEQTKPGKEEAAASCSKLKRWSAKFGKRVLACAPESKSKNSPSTTGSSKSKQVKNSKKLPVTQEKETKTSGDLANPDEKHSSSKDNSAVKALPKSKNVAEPKDSSTSKDAKIPSSKPKEKSLHSSPPSPNAKGLAGKLPEGRKNVDTTVKHLSSQPKEKAPGASFPGKGKQDVAGSSSSTGKKHASSSKSKPEAPLAESKGKANDKTEASPKIEGIGSTVKPKSKSTSKAGSLSTEQHPVDSSLKSNSKGKNSNKPGSSSQRGSGAKVEAKLASQLTAPSSDKRKSSSAANPSAKDAKKLTSKPTTLDPATEKANTKAATKPAAKAAEKLVAKPAPKPATAKSARKHARRMPTLRKYSERTAVLREALLKVVRRSEAGWR